MKNTVILEKIKKSNESNARSTNLKLKVMAMMIAMLSMIQTATASATDFDNVGDPTQLGDGLEKLGGIILDAVKPVSAVLVFMAVVIAGINMIIKRNKPEERQAAMSGLITIAIGCFILGSIGLIYTFIMSLTQ